MADAGAETAFESPMQAMNEEAGGYNEAMGNDSGEQIESSDEYDPAQDVPDVSLPGPQIQASSVDSPNATSRPASTNPPNAAFPNISDLAAATSRPVTRDSIKSPISTPNPLNSMDKAPGTASSLKSPVSTTFKARLPNDTVGILEDRIKEDEKGDVEAWLSLIDEHKRRGKIADARGVYERFLKIFPHAADQWIAFAQFESEIGNRQGVENIFQSTLKDILHLQLWCTYLDHIRRYFNINVDKSGQASQTNHAAYEAVLDSVGIDKDAGKLWQDFIEFIKSGPGTLGKQDWQSQSKMDLLRKAYQDAISIPTQAVEAIWKDYSNFENGLNKMTGRQFLQKKSADYMSARSSYTELQNITRDLNRTTLPSLPPALGFDGDFEYMKQVDIWRRWILWEKDDPLVLKDENVAAYRKRVFYVYKQALMALAFWPEMWFDAAEFCFSNDMDSEGDELIAQGVAANPESSLLAFKRADRLEMSTTNGNDDNSKQQRGIKVREPYDTLLNSLYALIDTAMAREQRDLARIAAQYPELGADAVNGAQEGAAGGEDDEEDNDRKEIEDKKQSQINSVKAVNAVQISLLNRTISHAWIALMRAMQRMQGKGKVNSQIGGSRQVFTDARKRGRITSEVWVAAALLEFHNSDNEAAKRIFERGMKLFPTDESFALEYIKLLTNVNDHTNARVVFEQTVTKLTQNPESIMKAKTLFSFFYHYESRYGELAQIQKLEARMRELFPDDPKLYSFSQRFISESFDPTVIRPLVSPATQARPKNIIMPSIEAPPSRQPTPSAASIAQPLLIANSPKRPPPLDDFESEVNRPRKLVRGESPLAGAAGRRLNQMRQGRPSFEPAPVTSQTNAYMPPPPPLPRDITFLLSIIPPASTYNTIPFKVDEMIKLIRETPIPSSEDQLPINQRPSQQNMPGQLPQQQYSQGSTGYFQGQQPFR